MNSMATKLPVVKEKSNVFEQKVVKSTEKTCVHT